MSEAPLKKVLDEAEWVTSALPVRLFGDPVLTTPCEPIITEEIKNGKAKEWADQLIEVLGAYRKKLGVGRGLASNQLGIAKQMAIVWLDSGPEVYINPEIVSTEGEAVYPESCISAYRGRSETLASRD